ncbi:hypothetical protein ACERNI_10760 [Camelimonas sp. ID_303_24]
MLAQLVLRRAALAAICPPASIGGVWPTMAQDRVFDSRLDGYDKFSAAEPRIAIVIYTEEMRSQPGSSVNGHPHIPTVQLILQVTARQLVDVDDDLSLGMPSSDPLLEAAIDTTCSQILHRLMIKPQAVFYQARAKVADQSSEPYRESEGGSPLAARAVILSCQMPRDYGSPAWARKVAALLPDGDAGRQIIEAAAAALEATMALDIQTPLTGVDITKVTPIG